MFIQLIFPIWEYENMFGPAIQDNYCGMLANMDHESFCMKLLQTNFDWSVTWLFVFNQVRYIARSGGFQGWLCIISNTSLHRTTTAKTWHLSLSQNYKIGEKQGNKYMPYKAPLLRNKEIFILLTTIFDSYGLKHLWTIAARIL